MRKVLLILTVFLIVSSLSAKENFMHNQLGFSASSFSGAGLSYKYIFNNNWAAKSTIFIYYNDNENYSSDLWASIGGEVQYYLHHSKHTGLYLFIGISEWYEESTYNYNSEMNSNLSTDYFRRFNVGPGFGLDLIIWNNIILNFDAGFIYAVNSDTYSNSYYNHNNNYSKSFTYGGGIGLSYRFY